jgi:hypothetical protein
MDATASATNRYAKAIEVSKRVRWEIERDVIKGRRFNFGNKFLPDGLTRLDRSSLINRGELRLMSQIQGRTYANIFGLVERFINAKMLELSRDHWFGDQAALEALVRFSDEEIKHQALFRRIEELMAAAMPEGYRFDIDADDVARVVLANSTWAVLALTLHIELFVQQHYRQSIAPDRELSPLFRDVFLFHWKDESQHVVLDEMELLRHDATLTPEQRDRGVEDFILLVAAVDGILQMQAKSDAAYFAAHCGRAVANAEHVMLAQQFLKAYRWQYILSGAAHPRFQSTLGGLITDAQAQRIGAAVAALR